MVQTEDTSRQVISIYSCSIQISCERNYKVISLHYFILITSFAVLTDVLTLYVCLEYLFILISYEIEMLLMSLPLK